MSGKTAIKVSAGVLVGLLWSTAVGQASIDWTRDWTWQAHDYTFSWNLHSDVAQLAQTSTGRKVWSGPLLPAFWLEVPGQGRRFVKAEIDPAAKKPGPAGGDIRLRLPGLGDGVLRFSAEAWGIRMEELKVTWKGAPPAILGMYFGSALLSEEQRTVVPSLEVPFWPGWNAEGYAVPSGKGAPVQSFFRNWDLGHATFPLGSFGPSLGTPYAAAFPRPLLSAAMGGPDGWVAFGPGAIPDGALTFDIRATSGTLHYLYREDLWGAPAGRTRVWSEPLRLAWASKAWDAFHELFASFGVSKAAAPIHQQAHWNTWGDFKHHHYDLRFEADQALTLGAKVLVIDDGWETSTGSGKPNLQRFPQFAADLQYIRGRGLAPGFWVNLGWINAPEAAGLKREDLLVGKDGRPRRATWTMAADSLSVANFCLDPSSKRTREFLRQRTLRMMRESDPQLLKLDFGYGLPGPDVSAPRDPAFRGERLSYELMRIIVEAAREVKPDVTIQYYGIHPLMRPVTDLVALDDLGDGGGYEAEAHGQWSIWSALAAAQGSAILASSGYDWDADAEILLNTAVIGAPGSVLPLPMPGQAPLSESSIAHRRALARWYRRTTGWEPLWLNSERGSIGYEPTLRCFGRLEKFADIQQLTALALRSQQPDVEDKRRLHGMSWAGRWALISQDDASIFDSHKLACIPFDSGYVELPLASRPERVLAVGSGGEQVLKDWTFQAGRLHLEVPPGSAPLLGFLVIRGD